MKHLLNSLLLAASVSASHAATVVHDFSGGLGTMTSDQFTGSAGNGWGTAWRGNSENASPANTLVAGGTPMASGAGDYLSRTVTANTVVANHRSVLSRAYTSTTGFDAGQAHTISFLWRADDNGTFTSTNDYFMLFGDSTTFSGTDTSSSTTWFVRYQAGTVNGISGGKFIYYDGTRTDGTSLSNSLFKDSGVTVAVGTTYQFNIVNDPTTASWTLGIEEIGGTSQAFQSGTLGWRRATSTASNTIAFGAKPSEVNEVQAFSIDQISIQNIPEPSAAILGAFGCLVLLRRKRA